MDIRRDFRASVCINAIWWKIARVEICVMRAIKALKERD